MNFPLIYIFIYIIRLNFYSFFLLLIYQYTYLDGFFFKTSGNISLNPSAGERAILIKTGQGDSMILVGKWTEFVWGKVT